MQRRDMPASASTEWKALEAHYESVKGLHSAGPVRRRSAARRAFQPSRPPGLFLDYSKNRITDETIRLLIDLARARGVAARRDAMFAGEKINVSEDRAVLHVALRADARSDDPRRRQGCRARGPRGARPDGGLLGPGALGRMEGPHRQTHPQCHQYRHRRLLSRAGDGLPGAPRRSAIPTLDVRFVANVDGADFTKATAGLDPHETLFIIASKTFTTLETMTNAAAARDWLSRRSAPRRPSRAISSRSRPTPRRCRSSASTPPTCSASGTGSAGATRWIRPSASRP